MKFTVVFIALLSISTSWAIQAKQVEESKDKREAPVGYASFGQPSGGYPAQSFGHGDASTISVGAGYSIGGAKPSYSFGGQGSNGALQLSSEHLASGGQPSIQLAPITLQPNHGSISSNDLSQLMSQLSHGINANGLTFTPANNIAEFHSTQVGGGHGGQELSLPQYSFGSPKFQQYSFSTPAAAPASAYASGPKDIGSYGATGPVLFTPESQGGSAPSAYAVPSSGHSFGGNSGISLGNSGYGLAGISLGSLGGHSGGASGHSLGGASGYSLGGTSGHSLGGASGNSLGGGSGYTLSGAGHSFGGSLKGLSGSYAIPSKNSFKPSAYLGSSGQGDSSHGLSGLSEQYSSPSFGAISGGNQGLLAIGSGDHGANYAGSFSGFNNGATYKLAPSFESVKGENLAAPLDAVGSFSSGNFASPPGTTYGFPASSYTPSISHAGSSSRPHFVSSPKHSSSSFGEGSSSYRGPSSVHSSFSSSPKLSYGGHSGSRYSLPRDSHGAHSETAYNTIKYSEELKPRGH
ncbi:hypothetical protein K1T71_008362 [Dendrolimus kikuchii]|uniref:Uncharacterized protein n=1 Tax=Dendrolimus kikuchii TaxID=765133 RepID=A0ACC1CXW5_9NEOP|nr:hypothetical protein K1T71_008362 [Dendrolimus kikuchii]